MGPVDGRAAGFLLRSSSRRPPPETQAGRAAGASFPHAERGERNICLNDGGLKRVCPARSCVRRPERELRPPRAAGTNPLRHLIQEQMRIAKFIHPVKSCSRISGTAMQGSGFPPHPAAQTYGLRGWRSRRRAHVERVWTPPLARHDAGGVRILAARETSRQHPRRRPPTPRCRARVRSTRRRANLAIKPAVNDD